jgi:hypothetical protein
MFVRVYPFGYQPVAECNKEQDEQEKSAGLVVEKPADCHEEDVAQVQSRIRFFSISVT